ncbi:hypothetical protein BT96DRAFT_946336 [Gymnopus androsaceus JB14]|uniref:Uncharacterized protein n=1 Tax=Gymnopus androsaceus JB14 TaxID=1447944 RepID=A0A6A4GWC9_9AGAR|nr:hypothetical protein BT96DRAFT_946336 [Gymnopus androsaceus JB14]
MSALPSNILVREQQYFLKVNSINIDTYFNWVTEVVLLDQLYPNLGVKLKGCTCDIRGYLHEKYPRVTGILSAGFPRVQHIATQAASSCMTNPKHERPICTNPPCPTKVSHTIDRCWAKGGGAEGKAPKSWRNKYRTTASSSTTPIDIFVGAMNSPKTEPAESIMPF